MNGRPNPLKAVLLDAGNTLVCLDYDELARLLAAEGVVVSTEQIARAEYAGRKAVNAEVQSRTKTSDTSRMRTYFGSILAALEVEAVRIDPLLEAIRLGDRRTDRGLWRVVPAGTHRALETLKERGLIVGVISNSDGRLASLLDHVGLTPLLAFALDSSLVGAEKPDPRIFRMGLERAGVAPCEAVYVGDLYAIDVIGARAVGMDAILVDPLLSDERDCPRIRSVSELPAMV